MNFITLFSVISLANVIFSTIKSLVTIKGGKTAASIVNALYFSYYNIVIIYTVSDFNLFIKCLVTFFANLVGVYIVKFFEEKFEKDSYWIFDATIMEAETTLKEIEEKFAQEKIKNIFSEVTDDLYLGKIFSNNKKESTIIKNVLSQYNVKFHIVEAVS